MGHGAHGYRTISKYRAPPALLLNRSDCFRSVAQMDTKKQCETGRELYPVKVVERGSEVIHLLLADAFGIPGQDLGLNLVDGSGDGCEEQLPPDTDMLLVQRQSRIC